MMTTMMKRKKCLADGGKLPNDYAEAALRRSQAKYGNAVPPTTDSPPPQRQDRPSQQAIGSVGQAMLDAIRNRDEQLRKAADYDQPRKFAGGGMPGVIREGNSFRSDPSYPALTLQTQSENGGLAATATPNVAAAPTAAPVSTPLSGAAKALPAPVIATDPTAMGNVFNNPSAGNVTAPAGGGQTFAERSIAAGINPNAAYRAGGPGDPHASGGLEATAAQRIAGANTAATAMTANQQAPQLDNPMDTISTRQRRQTRTPELRDGGSVGYRRGNEFSDRPMTGTIGTQSRDPVATTPKPAQKMAEPAYPQERSPMPQQDRNTGSGMTSAADLAAILAERRKQVAKESGMADGGIVPVDVLGGLKQAIAVPLVEDWKQANKAVKGLRDQYPTVDSLAGIHPAVAAAQVANDVMAGQVDGGTAINVAQAMPMVKGLTGMAKMLSKQSGPTIGGTKFVVDMPGTVRKNMALTAGQTLGQPANAFADGGMVRHRFDGKGGPRGDQIPVTVAGEKIKVSDGEEAVILPAKTAANPLAVQAIGQIIQQSNDGRAPAMGIDEGGRYAYGAAPHIVDVNGQVYVNGRPAGLLAAPPDPVRTDFTVDSAGNARGANQPGSAVGQYRGPGAAVTNYVPGAQPRPYDIAKPAPSRGMAYDAGKAAGTAYKNVGGISGAVGKLANIAVPAIAAAQTFGDDGIKVMGNRSSDPNYDETAGLPRVGSSLKEAALRAGDWGTKGLDILGGWALPKGEASFNDAYRQGVGQLEGVSAPTSQQIAAVSEQQQAQQTPVTSAMADRTIDANTRPLPDLSQGPGDASFDPQTGRMTFTQAGFDPTGQQIADGTGMISRAGGKNTVYTNMDPNQYVGADGKPGQTWEKTAQYADAMRRAQADRERLVRTQAENAVSDLASPRPDVRATADRQLQAIGQVQGIDSRSLAQAGQRQAVEANNPATAQQLAQQRIALGQYGIDRAEQFRAASAMLTDPSATPEERASALQVVHALNGKADSPPIPVPQGSTMVPDGMGGSTKVDNPHLMYDPNTKQYIDAAPAASNRLPSPKSKADVDKLPSGTRFVAPDGSVKVKP